MSSWEFPIINSNGQGKRKAAIYARVSSKEQEKEGFSIPAQLKLLTAYAAEKGFAVVQQYVDVETAKRAGRTGFTAMIDLFRGESKARIPANSCRVLLVEKTDPPIDRQYTVRFLQKRPDQWMTPKKSFKTATLPKGKEKQFTWFILTCTALKRLLDQIECNILNQERQTHNIAAPKIIDNAIVHYVKLKSGKLPDMA